MPKEGARLIFDINFTGNNFGSRRSPTRPARDCYRYDKGGSRQIGNAVTAATHDAGNRVRTLSATGPIRIAGQLSEPANVTVNGKPASVDAANVFTADVTLAPGTHAVAVSATDGSGNTRTNTYQVIVGTGTGERTLTYDLNGNLTVDGAGRTFTWDAVNRLASVTLGGNVTSFVYDGAGRRVMEKLNGVETRRWVWGGGPQPIEERDATNAVTKRFYAGLGEQIGGTAYFYTTDHLGSVRELTDVTGAVRARYNYTPYGERTKVSGDLDATFGFTGYLYHAASGLNLTLYRAYDAQLGRFISRDPIEESGGLNLYGYCGNDPTNQVDPLGLLFGIRANDAHDYWADVGGSGLSTGGIGGYAQVGASVAMMVAIDFFGSRSIENNAERAGDASGRGCTGEALKYGGLAAGQIALAAGGQYAGNTILYPFTRFIGPGSRAGFGAGTWLARAPIGSTPYGSVANAASKLQIPTQSGVNAAVNATKNVWWKYVAGPRTVTGNPQWGVGGGAEYRVGGF